MTYIKQTTKKAYEKANAEQRKQFDRIKNDDSSNLVVAIYYEYSKVLEVYTTEKESISIWLYRINQEGNYNLLLTDVIEAHEDKKAISEIRRVVK